MFRKGFVVACKGFVVLCEGLLYLVSFCAFC